MVVIIRAMLQSRKANFVIVILNLVIFRGIYFPIIVRKLAFSISFFFIFKLSEIIGCQDAHIFQENLSRLAKFTFSEWNPTLQPFERKKEPTDGQIRI